jgi:hypothetical protein
MINPTCRPCIGCGTAWYHAAVINKLRAFLLERGIVLREGPANLRNQMPEILEDATRTSRRACAACWIFSGKSGSIWTKADSSPELQQLVEEADESIRLL